VALAVAPIDQSRWPKQPKLGRQASSAGRRILMLARLPKKRAATARSALLTIRPAESWSNSNMIRLANESVAHSNLSSLSRSRSRSRSRPRSRSRLCRRDCAFVAALGNKLRSPVATDFRCTQETMSTITHETQSIEPKLEPEKRGQAGGGRATNRRRTANGPRGALVSLCPLGSSYPLSLVWFELSSQKPSSQCANIPLIKPPEASPVPLASNRQLRDSFAWLPSQPLLRAMLAAGRNIDRGRRHLWHRTPSVDRLRPT